MNYETKRIVGNVLNIGSAFLAGSSISLAIIHSLPWLFIFTALFLGLSVIGIFITRSADSQRRARSAASIEKIAESYAAERAKKDQ